MGKPIIGISTGIKDEKVISLNMKNFERIYENGGLPFILPPVNSDADTKRFAQEIDGLLLTGGEDVDPTIFDEEPHKALGEVSPLRDTFEISLAKEMLSLNKPIFGICRGSQVLNIATGGTLYQDIYAQHEEELLQHQQKAPRDHASHFTHIEQESKLYKIVQEKKIKINSYHHQAVKTLGEGMIISSYAKDQIVESIESTKHTFVLGVQWHPEYLNDAASKQLFSAFIDACRVK